MHASVPLGQFEPWKYEAPTNEVRFAALLPTGETVGFTPSEETQPKPELHMSMVAEQVTGFDLEAAKCEAAEIVAAAREEAVAIVAQQTALAVQEERAAQQALFAQVSQDLLTTLESDWRRYQEIMEREAAGVVVEIARQILKEHFQSNPEAILPTVREAVRRLADGNRVQVIVHPHHETAVRKAQDELLTLLRADSRLEIMVSDEIEVGGCQVYGDHGSLDARLETRLAACDGVVKQVLAEDRAA